MRRNIVLLLGHIAALGGSREHVLDGSPDVPTEIGNFGVSGRLKSIEKHEIFGGWIKG